MADLKAQIEFGADASGVETGVANVKTSIAGLGAAAEAAGEKASAGFSKVGTGADAAAKRIDASTKSLIGSIQRQIAQIESGGRGGSKFFETLATQRGVSVDALKPYLQQLDAVAAKQRVLESANLAKTFDYTTRSVKQTTAALRQVPAQLTDIFVSLQGGQAPLTVLLQQGGQLKDVFGGIGPAARALGGYLLSLVNPYTLLAGAVVGLGSAYYIGTKRQDDFAKSLIFSGNAVGSTVGGLENMATAISGNVGTLGQASKALTEFAADGNVSAANLEKFTQAAIRLENLGGQAVSKTVEQFAALGKDPLQASLKLNETTRHLTTSLYQQIRALDEQGRSAEAALVAQLAYFNAIDGRGQALEARLGKIDRLWIKIKESASVALNAAAAPFVPDNFEERLATASKELAGLEKQNSSPVAGLFPAAFQTRLQQQRDLVASMKQQLEAEGKSLQLDAERTKQTKARVEFDRDGVQFMRDAEKHAAAMVKAVNAARAANVSPEELQTRIGNINEQFAKKTPKGPRDPQRGIDRSDLAFDLSKIKSEADELVRIYSDAERILVLLC